MLIAAGILWMTSAVEAVAPRTNFPLCAGLTVVTAVSQKAGDYESIKSIDAVTARDVTIRYSSELFENGMTRRMMAKRVVTRADLLGATAYMHHFSHQAAVAIPGTTAIGVSTKVFRSLKSRGEAELGVFDTLAAAGPVDRNASPNVYDHLMMETIRRVSATPVMLGVTVDDVPMKLPAVHARGSYYGDPAEFWFLDDEDNPLALAYRIGSDRLDVVKIITRCKAAPPAADISRLERALIETGRADVYSIFFSFNSDAIREESAPTLDEIADVMRKHPDWKLGIEGHTDDVASDRFNLELSQRRAAAVKHALVTRKKVAPDRLTTAGVGEGRPKDRNDTLEGRARNRRVELVRVP